MRTRDRKDSGSGEDAVAGVVSEPGRDTTECVSQKDFDAWLEGFRVRYADALEYLRNH